MTEHQIICAMHTIGIGHYVRGDHQAANAVWIAAMEIAQQIADERGFEGSTRYLCCESWTNGLGHIALLDFFAKRKLLGLCDTDYVVLTRPGMVANQFYLDLWKPYFAMADADSVDAERVAFLQDYPMMLSVGDSVMPFMAAVAEVDRLWGERAPLLAMPPAWINRGWDHLEKLGIPRGRWFVTIHVRENGAVSGTVDDMTSIRNASLADYAQAVAEVVKAGGHPIRIGKAIGSVELPGMIDLCNAPDWMDVFLISQCRLFMGMNSGPTWVAKSFGVPALLTNWAPKDAPIHYRGARLMKKVLKSGSMRWEMAARLTGIESAAILAGFGVRAFPNEPRDIALAVSDSMRYVRLY